MNKGVFRIAVFGSRASYGRLAGIAAGVAVGVSLLLLLWGSVTGLTSRDARGAWLREGNAVISASHSITADTLLMSSSDEIYRDQLISQRRFASAAGQSTLKIPGVPGPPAPGTFYASPALQRLIESVPDDELRNRFGQLAGTIDPTSLPGPDTLLAISGATQSQLQGNIDAKLISAFNTAPYGESADAYNTAFTIGIFAMVMPVLLLLSTVSGLGNTQRRERFATLRLIGATPGKVAGIAAAETAAPALGGALGGVILAWLLRPVAANIPVNGNRFLPDDLDIGLLPPLFTIAIVVSVAASTDAYRTFRAETGPLGVTRAIHEKRPSAWRISPLITGIAMMAAAMLGFRELPFDVDPLAGGFTLIMIGLILLGPWLTMLASGLGRRFGRSAPSVIASSRISKTPKATFRAVAGLVIAVFAVSLFAGGSSVFKYPKLPEAIPGAVLPASSVYGALAKGTTANDAEKLAEDASKAKGIKSAVVGYAQPRNPEKIVVRGSDAGKLGLLNVPPTAWVEFDEDYLLYLYRFNMEPASVQAVTTPPDTEMLPIQIFLATDESPETIDRARTIISASPLMSQTANSAMDTGPLSGTRLVSGLAGLAYVGMAISIMIAAVSLTIATASAILDRRRVLTLMRLMGMPISTIRRIVLHEAVVPLVTVLALSAGLGYLTAWLMVTTLRDDYHVTWPAPEYYIALIASLVMATIAVATTFGLIKNNTRLTATRFD